MIKGENSEGKCVNCLARSACAFSVLNGDELRKTRRIVHQFACGADEIIFHQDEQALGAYILCQGRAKLLYRAQNGKKLLLRFCSPGDLLAGIASQEHAFAAVSVGPCVVSFIDKTHATTLIRQNPELCLEIGRRFAQDGQRLLQRMADLAYGSVEERLSRMLLELGEEHGVRGEKGLRIDLPLFVHDLADMTGCSRQTASRELHRFAKRGWIDIMQHTITLVNIEDLRRLG